MPDSKSHLDNWNKEKIDSKENQPSIPTHVTPHTIDKDVPSASVSGNIVSNASHRNIFPLSNIFVQSNVENRNGTSGKFSHQSFGPPLNVSDSLYRTHGDTVTDYNDHNQLHDLYTGNLIDLPHGYENYVEFDNTIKSFSPSQVGRENEEAFNADYDDVIGGQADGIEPFPPNLDFMSIFHGSDELTCR
jgi:hypothetical protein